MFWFLFAELKWHQWSCCRSTAIRMVITRFIRCKELWMLYNHRSRDPDIPAAINYYALVWITNHRLNREFISLNWPHWLAPLSINWDRPLLWRQQSPPSQRVIFFLNFSLRNFLVKFYPFFWGGWEQVFQHRQLSARAVFSLWVALRIHFRFLSAPPSDPSILPNDVTLPPINNIVYYLYF